MELFEIFNLFLLLGLGFPFSFILFMVGWHIFEMTELSAILLEQLTKKFDIKE